MSAKEMIASPSASPLSGTDLEKLVIGGDLSVLPPAAKAQHYVAVCNSLGLNPSTKPFAYIKLNGKEVLYALRDATDQLRSLKTVSVTITARELLGDVFQVTARASLPGGRTDESIGAVPIKGVSGEALANAYMKAETKAKRRVTLSICGLGFLDESEVGSIAGAQFEQLPPEAPPAAKPQLITPPKQKAKAWPAPPDVITTMPAGLCVGPFRPLAEFDGVPLQNLYAPDLELIVSTISEHRARVLDESIKRWLTAIEATATLLLRKANDARPGDDDGEPFDDSDDVQGAGPMGDA